jgi:hypothetical protein
MIFGGQKTSDGSLNKEVTIFNLKDKTVKVVDSTQSGGQIKSLFRVQPNVGLLRENFESTQDMRILVTGGYLDESGELL